MVENPSQFWSIPSEEVLQSLKTSLKGLTEDDVNRRLDTYKTQLLKAKKKTDVFLVLSGQFKSPITIILILAAILSYFLHDQIDAAIILCIITISALLGFYQEYSAQNAVEKLIELVTVEATVIRNGITVSLPAKAVVPGDIVVFSAGKSIPGDCLLLESKDLFIDEGALTGETYPVEKSNGVLPAETPLALRTNTLFYGTHIISGTAKAVVVHIGKSTEFGKVYERLKLHSPETEFEHGIRRFGYLLLEITLMLVITIFAVNVYLHKSVLSSLLFSLALAVGLTPQLLPAIISVNLAHGARKMAARQVIVKRLSSIENFGGMEVLCSDKTGTLTEGTIHVHSAISPDGAPSETVLFYAYLNAFFETGLVNPIDQSLKNLINFSADGYNKMDEIPYDFIRKRLSVLVSHREEHIVITKGALNTIISICSSAKLSGGQIVPITTADETINNLFQSYSNEGFRIIGVSYRNLYSCKLLTKECESEMTFLGFIVIEDPLKQGIIDTVNTLHQLGVSLKIITGDNKLIARTIGKQIGLSEVHITTGSELNQMSDETLIKAVQKMDIFAETEPNQKERILLALKKSGRVVGYLGDGINDASALHTADVGISVDSAADVAKEASDIVLLKKNLDVLIDGVKEGRAVFSNTMKYIFMATSANFGNMFSMLGASLFLPFLPLLPKQILLTNLLTDFPEMTIAADHVDSELVKKPLRWNISFIRKFMIVFGLISSVFDYCTFGVLLYVLHSTPEQFRTGWFIESVISASLIVLVVRSRKPFFKSRPGEYLLIATVLTVIITVLLPVTPLAALLGFTPIQSYILAAISIIIVLYILSAEFAKKAFYRRVNL